MVATPVQQYATCGPLVRDARGGVVSADLIGGGVAGRAFLARSRCGWSVELVAGGRIYTVRIRLPSYFDSPTIRAAGNLDGRPGEELLVTTDISDLVTYSTITFARGLHVMAMRPAKEHGFQEGMGGSYGSGFACLRPGLMEQVSWGTAPPTTGVRLLFAARGLTWRLVRATRFAVRGAMPAEVRRHPFARCA